MQFAPSRQVPYVLSPSSRPRQTPCCVEPTWDTPSEPQIDALTEAMQRSVEAFALLLARASRKVPTNPAAVLSLEQATHNEVAQRCVDPFFAVVLQTAHDSPEVRTRAQAYAQSVPGLVAQKKGQEVQVTLLGGSKVSIVTPYFLRRPWKSRKRPGRKRRRGARGKAGSGCYPVLVALGIHQRVTPALACEVSRLAVLGTYREASAGLAVRGILMDPKRISSLTHAFAQRGLAYRNWCLRQTQRGARGTGLVRGKRIVIGVDGGRIRVREKTTRGRRRKSGRRGFKVAWKEPKVFIIYEIDHRGRKRRLGLVRQDATLQDADGLFVLLAAKLRELGAHEAAQWIVVADGADWIWNRIPALVAAVGYSLDRVVQVVDFYHAVEHLAKIAEHVQGEKRRRTWFRSARKLLRRGLIGELTDLITELCKGRNARKIRKGMAYFQDHAHRMAYRDFEGRGIPIGSGAVESCIRRVVNLRLKGNSIYWRPDRGEALLHSRAQLLSGRWAHFAAAALQPECFWTLEGRAA